MRTLSCLTASLQMSWTSTLAEQLAEQATWGYRAQSAPATEPTALAALALLHHEHHADAQRAWQWLAERQGPDGSLGVSATDDTPCWPTSLAVLAWQAAEREAASNSSPYRTRIDRAVHWLLAAQGDPLPRKQLMGHDSTLIGWPWVLGTHSWLEPTAWAVLALKACGQANHDRTSEGVRLLIDRLLPTGGANYGNTFVLGQKLRPQIEPTGLALLALAGQRDPSGRIEAACVYLSRTLSASTPAISLSYGLLGLAAHDQLPAPALDWLQLAAEQAASQPIQPLRHAMLLLAAIAEQAPLLPATLQPESRT